MSLRVLPAAVLCMFLFAACSKQPAATPPEEDRERLVGELITEMLKKEVGGAGGHAVFRLAPDEIIFISSGVNTAGNDHGTEKPFDPVQVSRQYDFTKLKLKAEDTAFSQPREQKDPRYPLTAMLSIVWNVTYEYSEECSGFAVHTLLPPEWTTWDSRKKTDFIQSFYAKLPAREVDYMLIARMTAKRRENYREKANVPIRWDAELKQWELKDVTPGKLTAETPSWPAPEAVRENVVKFLTGQGFVEYDGKFYLPDDLAIRKKLDDGLVYVSGRWMSRDAVKAALALLLAQEKWQKEKKFGALCNLIGTLNSTTAAPEYESVREDAETQLHIFIQDWEQQSRKVYLKELQERLPGEMFRSIDVEKARKAVTAAIRTINNRELAVIDGFRKQLKQAAPEETAALPHLQSLTTGIPPGSEELTKAVHRYIAFQAIALKNDELLKQEKALLMKDSNFADLFEQCARCKGKGARQCQVCNGSRICQACRGSGQKQVVLPDREYRYVACPRQCALCPKDPACAPCRGGGLIFHSAKARARLRPAYEAIEKQLDALAAELKK